MSTLLWPYMYAHLRKSYIMELTLCSRGLLKVAVVLQCSLTSQPWLPPYIVTALKSDTNDITQTFNLLL